MLSITVQLLKPAKGETIRYAAALLGYGPDFRLLRAVWERPRLDLGYVVFEPGDIFLEYFYTNRWFNIFDIHRPDGIHDGFDPCSPAGTRKGWYCNVARPARFDDATVVSEDLELDLFVSPDCQMLLTLDMDEFTARHFERDDPPTHAAALAALAELERMARAGEAPFRLA